MDGTGVLDLRSNRIGLGLSSAYSLSLIDPFVLPREPAEVGFWDTEKTEGGELEGGNLWNSQQMSARGLGKLT